MEQNFWHDRWENKEIGWHEEEVNPLLSFYFQDLLVPENGRVFLPLCGKTIAISWLLSKNYHVIGAELNEIAVKELFTELKLQPEIKELGQIKHYHAAHIDIFVGDIFEITKDMLGHVDAVFDRGALVALPHEMRINYAEHIVELTNTAPQLLITYEYDQNLMDGPPFSITDHELDDHYAGCYKRTCLEVSPARERLRDICEVDEKAWLLQPL